jgi:hypothetical protein
MVCPWRPVCWWALPSPVAGPTLKPGVLVPLVHLSGLEVFMQQEFFLPLPEAPKRGSGTVNLGLFTLTGPNGELWTPAFTDAQDVLKWNPKAIVWRAVVRGFIKTIADYYPQIDGIIINPTSPEPLVIPRNEFKNLLRRYLFSQPFRSECQLSSNTLARFLGYSSSAADASFFAARALS